MKKIPTCDLVPGMIPAKTIYNSNGILLIAKGITLTASYINCLKKFRVPEVYIVTDTKEGAFDTVFSEASSCAALRSCQLLDEMKKYQTIDFEKNHSQLEQVVFAALANTAVYQFLNEMQKNPIVFNHCLRTALISVGMGLIKGYDFINLCSLATCALLHDCGMEKEFDEESNHHLDGFIKLRNNQQLEMINALVSLQHHERFDGLGKPLGLAKYQIIEFARLIAVADFYDRLIHLQGNTPRQAVIKVVAASKTLFDPDMVEVFGKTIFSIQPPADLASAGGNELTFKKNKGVTANSEKLI